MQKILTVFSLLLLTACSFGSVELTKENVFCEYEDESFAVGEIVNLNDGCNSCVCSSEGKLENCSEEDCSESTGMANPAAVRCSVDGFSYEIREDEEGGQFGVCIDEQNKECDAWEYFRSECQLGKNSEDSVNEEDSEEVENEDDVEVECLTSCCQESLDLISENGYRIAESAGDCEEDETLNSLRCEFSLQWCEPANN